MKIRPVGDELTMRTHGQAGRPADGHIEANGFFFNFVKAPKNIEIYSPASFGGQEKYMKNVTFPLPPLEATLRIFNVTFC